MSSRSGVASLALARRGGRRLQLHRAACSKKIHGKKLGRGDGRFPALPERGTLLPNLLYVQRKRIPHQKTCIPEVVFSYVRFEQSICIFVAFEPYWDLFSLKQGQKNRFQKNIVLKDTGFQKANYTDILLKS